MAPAYNWHYPTELFCGPNTSQNLTHHCKLLNLSKPLIVTDKNLLQLSSIRDILANLSIEHAIFSEVDPNPTHHNLSSGIDYFNANNCDGVIAIGGGSVLDTAKSIALIAKQSVDIWDLEDVGDNYLNADPSKISPCIAIPTTAGTGSEVGRAALIIDTDQKRKRFIFHPQMMPKRVILDPLLTMGLPAKLITATGMDALAHNLEALCVNSFHPMADGIAMEGLRIIKDNLPLAYQDDASIEAREKLLVAASMGATAFQKGLGAVHSLSHPIGARYNKHHGLLNAIFMPYVLQFNRPMIEDKMIRLAAYLALPSPSFESVLNWLLSLRQELEIPHTLAEIDIPKSDIDIIVAEALLDPSTPSNPTKLTTANLTDLLHQAFEGKIQTVMSI